MKIQEKTVFILVEPAVAGNIGAAARAIKTMGFQHLWLVSPKVNHRCEEAKMLAHGSQDILDRAKTFETLEHALETVDLAIGTTAKKRTSKQEYYACHQLKNILLDKLSMLNKVAIVFGREESGLTNQELLICDIASTIPLYTTYPSLNLGQAVMLYAYELGQFYQNVSVQAGDENKLMIVKEKASRILNSLAIDKNPNLYHRIFERLAIMGADDMNLLLSVLEKWQKRT
ncbi:MAG: tRNA/rRNA methyltransferase [Cyclobacteriaceae bacterium]